MGSMFDENDLLQFDAKMDDVEINSTDNSHLVRSLGELSIPFKGRLGDFLDVNPLSSKYKDLVLCAHEEIIGKRYSTAMEGLPIISPEHERDWPYPWGTKSPETVGRFLIAYGLLIKIANLPQNSRVLEVGCGVGSLTWNLSRMGYRVDAVDPSELQCDIVRSALEKFPCPANVVACTLEEWLSVKPRDYKYDAVIFCESFHHIVDHRLCLESVIGSHLEDDGKIILLAEPVYESTCELLPYPWGPRLDGESLRAMRRWGWLELGFTREYLTGLFGLFGMGVNKVVCNEGLPLSQIFWFQRELLNFGEGKDEGVRYKADRSDFVDLRKAGFPDYIESISGLGEREFWGRWTIGGCVTIRFCDALPRKFTLTLRLADVFGPNVHKKLVLRSGGCTQEQMLQEIEAKSEYGFNFSGVCSEELSIFIPHPCRPKDVLELSSEDPRKIGLGIIGFEIAVR